MNKVDYSTLDGRSRLARELRVKYGDDWRKMAALASSLSSESSPSSSNEMFEYFFLNSFFLFDYIFIFLKKGRRFC